MTEFLGSNNTVNNMEKYTKPTSVLCFNMIFVNNVFIKNPAWMSCGYWWGEPVVVKIFRIYLPISWCQNMSPTFRYLVCGVGIFSRFPHSSLFGEDKNCSLDLESSAQKHQIYEIWFETSHFLQELRPNPHLSSRLASLLCHPRAPQYQRRLDSSVDLYEVRPVPSEMATVITLNVTAPTFWTLVY